MFYIHSYQTTDNSRTIGYDRREFNQTLTQKLSIQLNIAHVARNKQSQCPFNSVQVKIHEGSPEGIRVTMQEGICERDEW